ncbi:MAG TPA: TonB-dependent siderophore receptor [Allosphingosinicella sp.]|uniref:TonB-dependent siderophore receptor n=1 Tax=Allosphingosinicella sp. TaxID=2823234 RepID=UPI002EDB6C66
MYRFSVSAAALATCLLSAEASAQAPSEEAAPALEDIVVTADRTGFGASLVQVGTFRNARIIDVPLTVNVVPQELIRSQAVEGVYDALRNTAGVSRSQLNGSAYDNVAVRGILVENRTSYRLNGSLPTINLVDLPLENKDRVEVLKGVGALYYGFAPPSGIVNMVTKRADRDVTAFTASATNHGALKATADIGRRFGDAFGLRLNGAAGAVETGVERFDGERYVGALAADWDVTDSLSVRFDAEHVAKDVTEPSALQVLPASQGFIPDIPDSMLNFGGRDLRYAARATNLLGRVDWRISPQWALTVEGGQAITERDRDFSQLENYGGVSGNGTLRVFRTRDQRYRNRNARAELAGVVQTGPITHNLIIGVTSNWRFQNGRNSTALTVAQNFFEPSDVSVPEPTVFTEAPLNIRDRGAYVMDRADFGPVELLAGARHSDYKSRSTAANGTVTRFDLRKWTPSFGLIAKPAEDVRLYATYLEGLEEGGTAPLNNANGGAVLPPAVSKQYELGAKGEAFKGVIFQAAAFQIDRPFAFTDPADNVFKLAGRSRYRGIEASVTGEISRELSVYASGQYLNAEVRRSNNALVIGKTPENTPEWTGSLYAEYRPAAVRGLAIGGGAFYVSERAVNALNQAFVDGYTTFSASARYTFEGITPGGLTLQLNADNLTNERYWSTAGNNLLGVGLPRQIKLTARVGL